MRQLTRADDANNCLILLDVSRGTIHVADADDDYYGCGMAVAWLWVDNMFGPYSTHAFAYIMPYTRVMYIYIYVHTHIYIYMLYIYVYMYIHIYINIHIYIYTYIYISIYICIYIYMYIYICIYIVISHHAVSAFTFQCSVRCQNNNTACLQ